MGRTSLPARTPTWLRGGFLLLLAGLVAGCSGSTERRATPATTAYPTGAACIAALASAGVRVEGWSAPASGACAVDTPVRALGTMARLDPSPPTSCSMLYAWMTALPELDRLARQQLGAGIRSVETFGSYSCRRMTGNGRRMSLHASARAIDIAAFELTDGSRVMVEKEWRSRSARGQFLRTASKALCARFSAVLTPSTDRAHHNHVHVDIGRWTICDV